MQRLTGILLFVGILTLPCWLTLVWYGQRTALRLEAQWELQEAASLKWLAFSHQTAQAELYWEHDREFEWKGEWYDVKKKLITTDSLLLLCYPDEKETDWWSLLSTWQSDCPDDSSPRGILLLSTFLNWHFADTSEVPGLTNDTDCHGRVVIFSTLFTDRFPGGPPAPPPRWMDLRTL